MSKDLGPLSQLVGTWTNAPNVQGFNLIAVPVKDPTSFSLLTHQYIETIVFKEITAGVPNRGGVDQQNITGLTYDLVVSKAGQDPSDPKNVLHVENGMFLYQADIQAQPANLDDPTTGPITGTTPFPIARQSSIPHGNTVLALGDVENVGLKGVPPFSILLINPVGNPTPNFDYAGNYPNNVPGAHQNATDLNQFLKDHIKQQNQTIGNVVTFKVDTANQGSISNIPFVQQHVQPDSFKATFWIEEILDKNGAVQHLQLQYSQVTVLNFDKNHNQETLVQWPHGNANSLLKVSDETHHRARDAHQHHGIHFNFPHLRL